MKISPKIKKSSNPIYSQQRRLSALFKITKSALTPLILNGLALLFTAFGITNSAYAATYLHDDTVSFSWETATTDVVWDEIQTNYPRDDDKEEVNIGFTFNFGGVDYTQVKIISNGALHFGSNQGFHKDYFNEPLPITSMIYGPGPESPADRVILPYWDDINPDAGGTVRYSALGAAPDRRFVVSWENIPAYPSIDSYILQVILYENGDIKFQYGPGYADGANATIGVEVDNTDFTEYSYSTAGAVDNGKAILFYIPRPHFSISHDGDATTSQTEPITITRHNNDHSTDTGYTGTITLSTSTFNGDWSLISGSGALVNNGSGSGTYTFVASDNGEVILGLSNSVDETLNIYVTDGTYSESAGEDPDLTFSGMIYDSYRDNFSVSAFNNSDGTLDWTGNSWIEIDLEGPGVAVGNALITGGELSLDDRPNNSNPSLAREVDLSPYTSATLNFDFRATNGIESADSVVVEASSDGGNNWTELENFTGFGGATAGSRSYTLESIPSFFPFSANSQIRFRVNSGYRGRDEQFLVDYVEIRVGSPALPVDHYAISHSGTGVTCEAEPVIITGHDSIHLPIKPGDGIKITISTTPAADGWALKTGTPANFTDLGGGVAEYTFATGESAVELWLTQTTTSTINIDVVDTNSIAENATEDTALTFADTAFRFYADGVASSIGTQIAGKASDVAPGDQTLTLQAIQTSPVSGACEARLSGVQTVEMAFECNNPATCQSANGVSISGTPIADNPDGTVTTYSNINLDFGVTGTATFTLNYIDAGQITLHTKKDISASPPDPAITLTGNSNSFVTRPFGFDLDFGNNSYAANAAGSPFIAAGTDFDMTLTSVLWQAADDADNDGIPDSGANLTDNSATPNFGEEGVAPSITFGYSLNAPATGSDGQLTVSNVGSTGTMPNSASTITLPFTNAEFNGSATSSTLSWNEVGIIDITAGLTNYLASGSSISGTVDHVGRFIPASFVVTLTNTPDFAEQVSSTFTYLGQNFKFSTAPQITIKAVAVDGSTVTQNYEGATNGTGFWKLGDKISLSGGACGTATGFCYTDQTGISDSGGIGVPLSSPTRAIAYAGTATANGTVALALHGSEVFSYAKPTDSATVNPFDADIKLNLVVQDDDGVSGTLATTIDSTHIGFSNDTLAGVDNILGNADDNANYNVTNHSLIRMGRATLSDIYGATESVLSMSLNAEYFDGINWIANSADTSTAISAANTTCFLTGIASCSVNGDDAALKVTGTATVGTAANFLTLTPTAAIAGKALITLQLPTWLQFDWDGDNVPEFSSATATFGIYRGDDRFYYWREVR